MTYYEAKRAIKIAIRHSWMSIWYRGEKDHSRQYTSDRKYLTAFLYRQKKEDSKSEEVKHG
jgi:hypothetical protein